MLGSRPPVRIASHAYAIPIAQIETLDGCSAPCANMNAIALSVIGTQIQRTYAPTNCCNTPRNITSSALAWSGTSAIVSAQNARNGPQSGAENAVGPVSMMCSTTT